jgi:hypothetical protein
MSEDDIEKEGGKVITFPTGQSISPEEIGADYILVQGNQSPVTEIVNPADISKEFRDREEFVQNQELLVRVNQSRPAPDIVDQVIKEIAEELSHLKYERRKAAKDGKNTANYTISRIASLRQLADVLMKRMENARAEQLDLKSPRFREVLKLWMEFVYESMVKVQVEDSVIDLVFRQIEADIKDWEQKIIDKA